MSPRISQRKRLVRSIAFFVADCRRPRGGARKLLHIGAGCKILISGNTFSVRVRLIWPLRQAHRRTPTVVFGWRPPLGRVCTSRRRAAGAAASQDLRIMGDVE